MIAFCVKTNNDKDCHEKFYEDIESLFRKDLDQYIVRVQKAYLSHLRTVEAFFNKYNGEYSKETITSSKKAKELYDKIVDYFPNNKYVTELGNKLTKKSSPKAPRKAPPKTPPQAPPKTPPKAPPKAQPKPQPKAETNDAKLTRLIDLYAEIYNKSNLEKQIIGDTFKERRKKALDIVEEVLKDAKEIDDLRKIMIADKSIYKSNPTPDDFRRSHAYGNNQPKSLVSYMRKLVKQSPE